MKNSKLFLVFTAFILSIMLTSCEVIGDIFQAGVWVGIIIVVAVIFYSVIIKDKYRMIFDFILPYTTINIGISAE